jgi:hypothetical protein
MDSKEGVEVHLSLFPQEMRYRAQVLKEKIFAAVTAMHGTPVPVIIGKRFLTFFDMHELF